MRIKEIELDNFKSFGKKTEIPVLPGFTTISGPNGSGKSNVIDSLMFALGLTTTRNMRAERLTDLLNNLTGRKDCSVKVTFIDDATEKETTVMRRIRVKTNGYDSKYFLNDEASTLTQVHEELGKSNISPHGFNVVMQGDVASIISMNPVERRKILDEIAGVAEFDRKIELADKELGVVQERIESQELILSEIKERLEKLQKERDQAIKYAELREKRDELERKFLAVRVRQLETQKNKTEEELEKNIQLKTDLQIENNNINEEMSDLQDELTKLNKEINELGEGRQREISTKLENKNADLAREESSIEYLNKQIQDQLEHQEKLTKEIKDIKKTLKEIDFKEEEFKQEIAVVQKNIEEEEEKYQAIQDKIRKKSENSNLSSQAVVGAQDKIQKLKDEKATIEQEKVRYEEQISSLKADLEKHRLQAEEVLNRLNKVREELGGADMDQIDAIKEQVDFQERNISALKAEQKDTRDEINKQQLKLTHAQKEFNKLEGQEQAANAAGYGRAVEMVLNMDGVHGTLAQLGSVDTEYQLALETAAGTRLRGVVVDDDYVASECIKFLRDKKAGRATFLPLNKLQQARTFPLPSDNGVIGWAIDLVHFDEQYRDAFSYAFANTLVVKNLQAARKMIGRYRMVTLQGDLLERSGAMTGGSAIKSNIHFGTNWENHKVKLEKEVEQIQGYIKDLQEEYNNHEAQIEESRAKIEKLREKLSKTESKHNTGSVQIESLEEAYEKEKSQLSESSDRIREIEEKLEAVNDKVFIKENVIKKEEEKLQELAAEMKDSGLEALVNDSQEIEIEVKRYQTMLNNLINESKSIEVEKNFSNQNIDKINTQIEESKLEVTELDKKVPQHQEKAVEIKDEITKLNEEFEQIKASLAEFNTQRDNINQKLMSLGERKGEIASKIESTAIAIVETKKKLEEIKQHYSQLKAELDQHPELKDMVIEEDNLNKLQAELNQIEKKMRSMEPINMRAVEEYEEVSGREKDIIEKLEALAKERTMIIEKIESFSNDKRETFMNTFDQVNNYFQDIFATISLGNGQLILEDPEEVFKGGLVIKAQPRGKKMQRLEAMSGGEKSLTALSFLFALQQCNPAPFYAFDEVDSALDGVNVERIATKINSNSNNTQFIVVSHRRPMLEQSDRAVGVSVGRDGFSKVIGIQNIDKEELVEEEKEAVPA